MSKESNPHVHKYTQEFLEYGEGKEGYWTQDRFTSQITVLSRSQKSSMQRRRDGLMCGYLTTVATTLPWLMMLSMLIK